MSAARHMLVALACLALLACGGGGGVGGGGGSPGTPIPKQKMDMSDPGDQTYEAALLALDKHGRAIHAEEVFATNRPVRPGITPNSGVTELQVNPSEELARGNFVATIDTRAEDAWRLGWTGRGVKIGVIDDFEEIDTCIYCRLGSEDILRSHGEAVGFVAQQVAPEAEIARHQLSFGCNLPRGTQDREITAGYQRFEGEGYHIVNNSWSSSRYNSGYCSNNPPILRDQETWDGFIDYTIKRELYFRSLALPTGSPESYDDRMLFIFVAGNDGATCPYGTGDCNLYASSILKMRESTETKKAGDRVIFVGALEDNQRILAATPKKRAG